MFGKGCVLTCPAFKTRKTLKSTSHVSIRVAVKQGQTPPPSRAPRAKHKMVFRMTPGVDLPCYNAESASKAPRPLPEAKSL